MEKTTKLSDLIPDASNYNKHTAYGMGLLEKSMRKDGFVEAGLISEDNVICSGNARQETAINIGLEDVQIIDIDGTKPIYLRKKGLQSGTKEFKELALQLNAVGKANVIFDAELIEAELGIAVCEEWGVPDYSKGMDVNNMTDDDVDIEDEFDPIGTMDGKQRVVFLFDGKEEAESYLNSLKVDFKKMNMAWQVNMTTPST